VAKRPGVGDGIHRLDVLDQAVALLIHLNWPFPISDDGDVAFFFARCNFERATGFRQAEQVGAGGNGSDKVLAGLRGLRGLGLEFGFIHRLITFSDC